MADNKNNTFEVESENLEAHIAICSLRYNNLDSKLNGLEKRMDKLEEHVLEIKDSIAESSTGSHKTMITIGTSIISALLGGCLTLVIHLITK